MSNAFSNHSGSGIWCKIAGGKVRRKATADTPGAVEVKRKEKDGSEGKESDFFLQTDRVEGRIVDLRITEKDFGDIVYQLVVTLDHEGERINVTMKQGDRYWRAFMTRLPNVDLSKPVIFAPYDFKDKSTGKDIIGLNLLQQPGPDKVEPFFTKDAPGDMPPMDKVTYKGKERADFSRQDDWLNANVLMPTKAKLSGTAPAEAAAPNVDDISF